MNQKEGQVVRAIMDFDPAILEYTQQQYQLLSFKKDDEIIIDKEGQFSLSDVKKWVYGHINKPMQKELKGWFPSNFVTQQIHIQTYFELPWTEVCQKEDRLVPQVVFTLFTEIMKKLRLKDEIENRRNQPDISKSYSSSGDQTAPDCEGIFRRQGNTQKVQDLSESDEIDTSALKSLSLLDMCQLFKKFYQLKKVKFLSQNEVRKINEDPNIEKIVQILIQSQQSPERFVNFMFLLHALHKIIDFAQYTKMPIENIIQLFEIHIIDLPAEEAKTNQAGSRNALQLLIESFPAIQEAIYKHISRIDFDQKLSDMPRRDQALLRGAQRGVKLESDVQMSHELQKCVNLKAGSVIDIKVTTPDWTLVSYGGFRAWVPTMQLQGLQQYDDDEYAENN